MLGAQDLAPRPSIDESLLGWRRGISFLTMPFQLQSKLHGCAPREKRKLRTFESLGLTIAEVQLPSRSRLRFTQEFAPPLSAMALWSQNSDLAALSTMASTSDTDDIGIGPLGAPLEAPAAAAPTALQTIIRPTSVPAPPFPERLPHVQQITVYYSGRVNLMGHVNTVWVYEDPWEVPNCWYCHISSSAAQDWTWIRACRENEYLEELVSCRATRWNGYLWITMCRTCLVGMLTRGINIVWPSGFNVQLRSRPPPPPREEPPPQDEIEPPPRDERQPPVEDDRVATGEEDQEPRVVEMWL